MPRTLTKYWVKVKKTDTCWLWIGARCLGYGVIRVGTKQVKAHRVFYEHLIGAVPTGLQLDHLCRVKNCVNPSHLEPVTPRVNTLRGVGPTAQNAKREQCLNGHPFLGENLYLAPDGERGCRACKKLRDDVASPARKEYWQAYYLKRKEQGLLSRQRRIV